MSVNSKFSGGEDGYKPIEDFSSKISDRLPKSGSFARLTRTMQETEMKQMDIKDKKEEEYRNKKINFTNELKNYRKRTETKIPYTIQQIEDVMFIDEKKVVSLEYIFYSKYKDARYHRLKKVPKDSIKNESGNNLGT